MGSGNIMVLNLIKVNDIAPNGKQPGTIVDLVRASGKDEDNNDYDDIVLTAELDATDKSGKKFRLVKRYKLGTGNRGLGTFRSDFKDWSGRKLKDQDLVAFDADALMKGQRATFVVKQRKDGKELVAVLDKLLPAPAAAQAQ
jgi:hypothetical protein